jgi:hypothetical protein
MFRQAADCKLPIITRYVSEGSAKLSLAYRLADLMVRRTSKSVEFPIDGLNKPLLFGLGCFNLPLALTVVAVLINRGSSVEPSWPFGIVRLFGG